MHTNFSQRILWKILTGEGLRCILIVVCCLSGEGSSTVSPLTPGDLLIALHNIDSTKCDMKSIIKGQCSVITLSLTVS